MARLSFHYLKWNFVFEVQFTSVIEAITFRNLHELQLWERKFNCHEDNCKEAKQHNEYAVGTYFEANNAASL